VSGLVLRRILSVRREATEGSWSLFDWSCSRRVKRGPLNGHNPTGSAIPISAKTLSDEPRYGQSLLPLCPWLMLHRGGQSNRSSPVAVAAPIGQDVDQKAADELVGVERHKLVASIALGPVILPFEGHALAIEGDEAVVGNSNPVRLARQVKAPRSQDRMPGSRYCPNSLSLQVTA
jgi:hypothetical protein